MAMTKVEAAKLTQDMLLRGVIETIITESMILELLPFMEVTGTAVTYNREATLPAATFYDVGDAWTEATPTFTQKTATLKILGGDADVDNFIQATYADPNDVEAEVIANRAKSVAYKFNEWFDHAATSRSASSVVSQRITPPRTCVLQQDGVIHSSAPRIRPTYPPSQATPSWLPSRLCGSGGKTVMCRKP